MLAQAESVEPHFTTHSAVTGQVMIALSHAPSPVQSIVHFAFAWQLIGHCLQLNMSEHVNVSSVAPKSRVLGVPPVHPVPEGPDANPFAPAKQAARNNKRIVPLSAAAKGEGEGGVKKKRGNLKTECVKLKKK